MQKKKPFTMSARMILLLMVVLVMGFAGPWVQRANAGENIPEPKIVYVNDDAEGADSGGSWDDAYIDLQSALEHANDGDQIWVAAGTYYPTDGSAIDPRYFSFQLVPGVEIYGGFDGTEVVDTNRTPEIIEAIINDRNISDNETILSGDIDQDDNLLTGAGYENNSYHVVVNSDSAGSENLPDVLLDGFTITGGYAGGPPDFPADASNYGNEGIGGGMYNFNGSPTLANLTFVSNYAINGSGMYNSYCSPTMTNVSFLDNYEIVNSTTIGSAMHSEMGSLTLNDATFSNNHCAAMYSENCSQSVLNGALFDGNDSCGMINLTSTFTLNYVTFSNNKSSGMRNTDSPVNLTDVNFIDNHDIGDNQGVGGGGMYNFCSSIPYSANIFLTDVTFSNNTAIDGGGMYNQNCNAALTNLSFYGNNAMGGSGSGGCGGGLFNKNSIVTLDKATFLYNETFGSGGGQYNLDSDLVMNNAVFNGNKAEHVGGGGMFNSASDPIITNATFSNNETGVSGGGIYNFNSFPAITNCILWNNIAGTDAETNLDAGSNWSPEIYNAMSEPDNTATRISYSLITFAFDQDSVWDSSLGTDDGHNLNSNPLFYSQDNLRLRLGSPAIDSGSPDVSSTLVGTRDVAGNERFVNDDIDLGAYEYQYGNFTVRLDSLGTGSGVVEAVYDMGPLVSGGEAPEGAKVDLTATPAAGSHFDHWEINGEVQGDLNYEMIVDSNMSVIAYFLKNPSSSHSSSGSFSPVKYTLTVASEGQGTVSPAAGGHDYTSGTKAVLKAVPAAGWEFVQWLIDGSAVKDADYDLEMTKDITAKAVFKEITASPAAGNLVINLVIDSNLMRVNSLEQQIDAAPFAVLNPYRAMVPVKFIAEQLGAKVTWHPETRQVRIIMDGQEIVLTVGSRLVLVNGKMVEIDAPAVIRGSRLFVPLRFISETMGATVQWSQENLEMTITQVH